MVERRLADLVSALSLASDLGMGQAPESGIRSCLVATRLARKMGVAERDLAGIYYVTLLQHVGCTAYAHETAALFGGDDIAVRAGGARVDFGNPRESLSYLLLRLGRGAPARRRVRAVVAAVREGAAFDQELARSNCDVAVGIAARLGLDPAVQRGLNEIYERWDGKGNHRQLAGDEIALPARFAQVASQAVVFHQVGGSGLAREVVRRRAGTMLDPEIAGALVDVGGDLLDGIAGEDASMAVVEAEPLPQVRIPESRLDDVAAAFAAMVDLKSPWLHGHSAGVSRLAAAAAVAIGLPGPDRVAVRRAGFLQDVGRVGVPSGVWDKPGPLTTGEWEQVRLHPYHSERILSRSTAFTSLAMLAGMHHERLDGSGYHRQATTKAIPIGARILAASDAYQAMSEDRPWRPALPVGARAEQLTGDVERGRLDAEAVAAVLTAAGQGPSRLDVPWPAGLTGREVQVLRLAARGRTNREIADALYISPKTAGHHVQHIYAKIGVSTRAGAALFAMEHDLVRDDWLPEIG